MTGGGSTVPSGATILVVEDYAALRYALRQILDGAGFRVLLAESAEEALALADAPGQPPIDLIVADVGLPGTSGPDLVQRMAAARPGLRHLLISGWAPGEVADSGQAMLRKPFQPDELLRAVRAALEGQAP